MNLNRNTLKFSYSYTEKMSCFILRYNMKVLKDSTGNKCPLDRQCIVQDIVYKYVASTPVNPGKAFGNS